MIDSLLDVLAFVATGLVCLAVGYSLGSSRSYKNYTKKNDFPPAQGILPTISVMDNVYVYPKNSVMSNGVLYPV